MSRKAGSITIDLDAGTSKFFLDIDKAKAKLREFGEAGVGEHKAVAAAMKTLEGNFTNNSRAADAFIAKVLGAGPLLEKAFPVIGAIAFAGVLAEIGSKVRNFFKEMANAPDKIAGDFRKLNDPLRAANAELELSNARLEN